MKENRSSYRKNLKVAGTLVYGEIELPIFTKNISLHGFQACCTTGRLEAESLETSDMVYVRLPDLNLEGVVAILWSGDHADGFNFGFKFLNMRGVDGSAYHYRDVDNNPVPNSEAPK